MDKTQSETTHLHTGTETRDAAKRAVEARRQTGVRVAAISQVVSEYRAHLMRQGHSKNTVRQYGEKLRTFLLDHPDSWRSLKTIHVEQWLDSRQGKGGGPLTSTSRAWWAALLTKFYSWALLNGYTTTDPGKALVRPKRKRWSPQPLSDSDASMILALTSSSDAYGKSVALMLYAGLRCAEVSALRWADVDRDAGRMMVTGKGDKTRWIMIHPELDRILGPSGPANAPVIGKAWKPKTVSENMRTMLRDYDVKATGHKLRHTFATTSYQHSPDLLALRDVLGHENVATTQAYVKVADAAKQKAVSAVSYGSPVVTTKKASVVRGRRVRVAKA